MNVKDLQKIQRLDQYDQLIVQTNDYTKQITYCNFLKDNRLSAIYNTNLFSNLCVDIDNTNTSTEKLSTNNEQLNTKIDELQQLTLNVDPQNISTTLSTLSINVIELYGSISNEVTSIISNLSELEKEINILSDTTNIKTKLYIENENNLLISTNYYISVNMLNLSIDFYNDKKLLDVSSEISVISSENGSEEITSYYVVETNLSGNNYFEKTKTEFIKISNDLDFLSTEQQNLSTSILDIIKNLNSIGENSNG